MRQLVSKFFARKRGKQIQVKASWVGPTDTKVGGKHYRVIVDA